MQQIAKRADEQLQPKRSEGESQREGDGKRVTRRERRRKKRREGRARKRKGVGRPEEITVQHLECNEEA